MVLRFTFLITAVLGAFAFLVFRVYNLQLVHGNYYTARAQSEFSALASTAAARGLIYLTDKGGNRLPIALNKDFPVIYAVPKTVEDAEEATNTLAPILSQSTSSLLALLSKPNDSYELLMRKAGPAVAQEIDDLKMKGIYVDTESERFYPLGTLAANVLGFVGPNSADQGESGHYGLEELYNRILSGNAVTDMNSIFSAPQAGDNLNLTIDPNIQIESERILGDLVKAQNADGGSVIVEDPRTGKLLAMASVPNFDPNNYSDYPIINFINPNVSHIYEPGSVFKIITMAAGIDSGKLTPDTKYYDTGSVTLNRRTITNYDLKTHGPYGWATMTNVIEHSINTGAVFAERQIGRDIFTAYVKKFGFGEKTGVDLPGEVAGDVRRLSPKEQDVAFATAAYGQGVAVTPLEIVNAFSAVANGGTLMRPYVNAALKPQTIREVISSSTAREVTQMMISAVDKAGVAQIAGFSVAGKTGTAFIPDFKNGGYTDRVIDSYAGFAPASNPKFVVLIKLDNLPQTSLAAQSVVPAFHDLAQYILNYLGAQPDRIQ